MAQKVTIAGIKSLERKLGKLPAVVEDGLREAVKAQLKATAEDERQLAPRDTGELADSIQTETADGGLGGIVAVTADHATYVNNGTRDTPAQPFATAAAKLARKQFPDRVVDELNEAVRRAAK